MRETFVIISVSDRVDALNGLMATIVGTSRFDRYAVNLYLQDPENRASQIAHQGRYERIIIVPELQGCHGARVNLLRALDGCGYDTYINLDDDMELIDLTDYSAAVEFAADAGVGFVMTNWARNVAGAQKKRMATLWARASLKRFKKQIMLYNGGGMVYGEKIARLMRELPPVKTAFDCAWPITAYVNGYVNYRDQGSLAIHRVCGTGGMRAFMTATPLHLMATEWLDFEPAKHVF